MSGNEPSMPPPHCAVDCACWKQESTAAFAAPEPLCWHFVRQPPQDVPEKPKSASCGFITVPTVRFSPMQSAISWQLA